MVLLKEIYHDARSHERQRPTHLQPGFVAFCIAVNLHSAWHKSTWPCSTDPVSVTHFSNCALEKPYRSNVMKKQMQLQRRFSAHFFFCFFLYLQYKRHLYGTVQSTDDRKYLTHTLSSPRFSAVWHIPLLCVQYKTPDDGQKNCPKHEEFHSKNKFASSWLLLNKP
jgi:hypothetical protein